MCKCAEPGLGPDPSLCSQNLLATQANPSTFDLPPPRAPADMAQGPAVTAPLLQLNYIILLFLIVFGGVFRIFCKENHFICKKR